MDLPCYTSPALQEDFRNKISKICEKSHSQYCNEDTEIVKILAPLTENPNAAYEFNPFWSYINHRSSGDTPILLAARKGYTEIVKILAPLTDNPNVADDSGETPINTAAYNGFTEIVKILVPLTDNPNAPSNLGKTPSAVAKNAEICGILESFNTSRKHHAGSSTEPSKKQAMKF